MKYLDYLGLKVKDRVTGFEGVVSSICFDLYGCVQVAITPPAGADGKLGDGHWFDIKRLELKTKKPVIDVPDFREAPGAEIGPEAKPQARAMPTR